MAKTVIMRDPQKGGGEGHAESAGFAAGGCRKHDRVGYGTCVS